MIAHEHHCQSVHEKGAECTCNFIEIPLIEDKYAHGKSLAPHTQEEALGIKADKPQLSLIPPTALRQEARAMENGLKYGRCSYRKPGVVTANGLADAMMRHIQDWLEGEDNAPDSGVHHLAHVRAGAGILLDLINRDILTDDRDI